MTDSPLRRVRQLVLEALYESDTSTHGAEGSFVRLIHDAATEDATMRAPALSGFGVGAIRGVTRLRDQLDDYIQDAATLYPVETMAVVDRNILRLAIWELVTDDSAPVGAVVNEAVELAHRYSGESSPPFINGVLRTISQRIRGAAAPATSSVTPENPSGELNRGDRI
ncbi:MAG: transcription antitermination factor NusB [Dehalococcoidia bacterium]|nr:transcription antitermination factor NusB [Dehalococcoidia bacterium]